MNQGKTVADIDCEATKALFEVFEKTMNLMSAK